MADSIRRSSDGKPSVQAERRNNWTAARRATFLDHLAATCNVAKACAAVGMHPTGAYKMRRREPAFAEQWHAALMTGYDRIEAALIEHITRTVAETEHGDVAAVPFDVAEAIAVLKMHHARSNGRPDRAPRGPAPKRATEEETDAAILKQLAALERRKARGG